MAQDVAVDLAMAGARPTKPLLPQPLRRLLSGGMRDVGDVVKVDHDWTPPTVDPAITHDAAKHIQALELFLRPAKVEPIAARVTVLLSHFFVADQAEGIGPAVIEDWLYALERYPMWAIQQACRDWLCTHRQRPTIADITELCEFWVGDARTELALLRKLIAVQPKPDVPATTH